MKVEGRRTYRQGQVYSKRRLSSLKAGILYRPLVCVRHVNRIWDLGLSLESPVRGRHTL